MTFKENIIIADQTNFSFHGGAEKNGIYITQEIEKFCDIKKVLVVKKKFILIKIWIKAALKIIKVKTFLSFKNSAFTALLFKLVGAKIVMRVNNSPESYLYWLKFSSLLSLLIKIYFSKKDILIFNSKKIKNYFEIITNMKSNLIYIPNYILDLEVKINVPKKNKIYIASRLSWEKNFKNTYEKLQEFCLSSNYDLKAYSSSIHKNKNKNIETFNSLQCNYNDIYVSFSYFEGMPNMALESLLNGSALILSNCWSHVELMIDLEKFDLNNRILICDLDDMNIFNKRLKIFLENLNSENIETYKKRINRYSEHLKDSYKSSIKELTKIIN